MQMVNKAPQRTANGRRLRWTPETGGWLILSSNGIQHCGGMQDYAADTQQVGALGIGCDLSGPVPIPRVQQDNPKAASLAKR